MTNAPYPDDASLKRLRKEVVDENAQYDGKAKATQGNKADLPSSSEARPEPDSADKAEQ